MRKGFTLIELMIVIIIIAILAVVAVVQYNLAIERTRSAEAKEVLGYLRKTCASIYAQDRNVLNCTPERLGIGMEEGMFPNECYRTHYFSYSAEESPSFENVMLFTATRCMKYGRAPNAEQPGSVILTVDYKNGTDTLSAAGAY
ncbi:MAG: prepilin-type N-terminal cleavage/methylation domain-containing protein [Candidatus Omnitrophota bacterium]